MALNGDFESMPLPDLLQWAATARRSGTLTVERDKVTRRIQFREGRVIGCSSNEPPALLGQFLLSQGKITEQQLRQALERQEATGESISDILISMKILNANDLQQALNAKAEETIFGLFDWNEAVFRFEDKLENDPYAVQVDLNVQDVVLRGLQRLDEMNRFREVFANDTVVLEPTGKALPPKVMNSRMARKIVESINGTRTVAEIKLHAHASEFLVTKFLYQLHRMGVVKVKQAQQAVQKKKFRTQEQQQEVQVAAAGGGAVAVPAAPDASPPDPDLGAEISVAVRFMSRGEHEAALEILNASYRAHPGDQSLRQLIAQAEQALETAHRQDLAPEKIPVMKVPVESLSGDELSPEASFLPSMIDGNTDIKSILWLAPMRSVDVLRALKSMLDKGHIALRDPD